MAARIRKVNVATVRLWGRDVGAVAWDEPRGLGNFEYDPAFVRQGWPVAPLMMPVGPGIFSFPAFNRETFHGLPGLLADSLPDRFGNRLIDLWLTRQGRAPSDFTPVARFFRRQSQSVRLRETFANPMDSICRHYVQIQRQIRRFSRDVSSQSTQ
jgi:hypothetical protein